MTDTPRNLRRLIPIAALAFASVALVAFAVGVASNGGPAALAANPTTIPGHPELGNGWRMPMGWHMGGRLGMDVTITAIDGTKLSLKTDDGWTRTIDAAGATITRAGKTISAGDLRVGDQIAFRQQRQSDGTFKITAIDVVLPTAAGTVSAVTDSSVTITVADGSTKTLQLTGSTTYQQGGQTAAKSALVKGVTIVAEGSVDSSGTFTASLVRIEPSVVTGTVTGKTADSIVVKTADGKSVTIKVSSSTQFRMRGQAKGSLANVAVGDSVFAQGTLGSDGSLSASVVGDGVRGMMPGFGKGFGRGMGPWMGRGGMFPNQPGSSPAPASTSGSNL